MATHEPDTAARPLLGRDDAGRLLTAEEFAGAIFREPWKYERVAGRLLVMAPEGEDHIDATSPWLRCLFRYWDDHPEVVQKIVPNAWVRVDEGTDRIGDVGVYLVPDRPVRKIPDRVPDLMFEIVSPGRASRDRDYVEKRAEYHRLGIREYVVVDRFQRRVTVLTHAPDGYLESVLEPGATYESPLLPGLAIPLGDVLET